MKLSTKITIMFIFAALLTIMFYIVSSHVVLAQIEQWEGKNIHIASSQYMDKINKEVIKKNISTITILLVIATIGINLTLGVFIQRIIIKRIKKLNENINRMKQGADLSERIIQDDAEDEITTLTKDINLMFHDIQSTKNKLTAKQQEDAEKIHYIANYDTLTGLLNRYSLYEKLNTLMKEKISFAIYFIDLDNFKMINDTLGHHIGDRMLITTAEQLRLIQTEGTIAGRLGGDEFIVIRMGIVLESEAEIFGQELLNKIGREYHLEGYNFQSKASIGVSLYPYHSDELEQLMQYADMAMYESKEKKGNHVEMFSKDLLECIQMQKRLKEAIKNKELRVYYQPVYDMKGKNITGAEALIRWVRGNEIILPKDFLWVAKKTDNIEMIDSFVLQEASAFCKQCIEDGFEDFQVIMNTSMRFLMKPHLIDYIQQILEENGLNATRIRFEITETEVMYKPKKIINVLRQLKEIGIQVSIDNFGSGNLAIEEFKALPIDTLKIDMSLLKEMEESENTLSTVQTLIRFLHELNFKVMCQGIEEVRQLNILQELNCDKIQGYYIGEPITPNEFRKIKVGLDLCYK